MSITSEYFYKNIKLNETLNILQNLKMSMKEQMVIIIIKL